MMYDHFFSCWTCGVVLHVTSESETWTWTVENPTMKRWGWTEFGTCCGECSKAKREEVAV